MDELFGADVKAWNANRIVLARIAAQHANISSQDQAEQGKSDISMREEDNKDERYWFIRCDTPQ